MKQCDICKQKYPNKEKDYCCQACFEGILIDIKRKVRTLEGRVTKQQNQINELKPKSKQKEVWRRFQ